MDKFSGEYDFLESGKGRVCKELKISDSDENKT